MAILTAPAAFSQTNAEAGDVIRVWGQAMDQIGEAHSASEGLVGYDDIATRPISRVGELAEVIPGMIATQHSGTGKANQYFLRGFNLDHGTDFAGYIDGAPANMRSHGHGQGYLDLNPLIPEFVSEVRFRKGPYHADDGDFSLAGSARFSYYDRLPDNFLSLEAGEFGFVRTATGHSVDVGRAVLTFGGEYVTLDGPWSIGEDAERVNLIGRLSGPVAGGQASLTLTHYDSDWRGADQIPERAVLDGRLDRFGVVDPTLGGQSRRTALTARWTRGTAQLDAYAVQSDFTLFSNFTYQLEDPVGSDQFEQRDRRWLFGGRYTQSAPISETVTLNWGASTRFDDIGEIGLYQSNARVRTGTVRRDRIEEWSIAGWLETEWRPVDALRLTAGLRGDRIDVDVDALSLAANGGSTNDSLLAPKFGAAWRIAQDLELYANAGRGFHSNDARGATIAVDPSDSSPAQPVPLIVTGDGQEIGLRLERGGINLTLAAFRLTLDGELVFVGDGGATEPNGATERQGVEAAMFWDVSDWLVADFEAAWTDARYRNAGADDRIPGAVETVLSAGLVARHNDLAASVRVRHFGSAPLTESGDVTSDPTTLVNLGLDYDLGRMTVSLDIFNLFDAEDADITYFYESRLPGETSGIEDRHFRAVEPRQVRLGAHWRF